MKQPNIIAYLVAFLLAFLILLCSIPSRAQTVPAYPAGIQYQSLGGPSTVVHGKGYIIADKGLSFSYFADTTTANLTLVDAIPFCEIVTADGTMWLRNLAKTAWIKQSGFTLTSGNGTTANGTAVDLGGNWTAPAVISAPNNGSRYIAFIDTGSSSLAKMYIFGKRSDLSSSILDVVNFGAGVGAIHPVAQFRAANRTDGQYVAIRLGEINTNDANEGYLSHYRAGNNDVRNSLVLSFGNSRRVLTVESDGKVLIQSSTTQNFPSATLHVDGSVRFQNITASPTDSTNYKPAVIDANGNVTKSQGWPSTGALSQWTTSASAIYYNNPVGIGNSAPSSDYLTSIVGTSTADNSRVLNVEQYDNSGTDTTSVAYITNLADMGTLSANAIYSNGLKINSAPAGINTAGGNGRPLNSFGIDAYNSLSNQSFGTSTFTAVINSTGVSGTSTGSPVMNDSQNVGSANVQSNGVVGLSNMTPTRTGTDNLNLISYGGVFQSYSAINTPGSGDTQSNYAIVADGNGCNTTTGTTENVGVYIVPLSATSDNNYGIYINNISGGAANYALYNAGTASIHSFGKSTYDATITAAGTTGNRTINKPSGTVNIAAAGTTVTVTNSFCTTSSIVIATIRTNDATAYIKNVVPNSGSFDINLGAAATAEISIGFIVYN